MRDSARKAMFAKKVKVAESSHNFRNLDNPNNEYGHYSSHDAVKGESWCPYCGGLTKQSLSKHLETCGSN